MPAVWRTYPPLPVRAPAYVTPDINARYRHFRSQSSCSSVMCRACIVNSVALSSLLAPEQNKLLQSLSEADRPSTDSEEEEKWCLIRSGNFCITNFTKHDFNPHTKHICNRCML